MKRAVLILALVTLALTAAVSALNANTFLHPDASHNPWGNPLGATGALLTLALGLPNILLLLTMFVLALILAAQRRQWGWLVLLVMAFLVALVGPNFVNFLPVDSTSGNTAAAALAASPLVLPFAALVFSLRPDPGPRYAIR